MPESRSWAAPRSKLLEDARGRSPAQMPALLTSVAEGLSSNYSAYNVMTKTDQDSMIERA